MDTEKTLGEEDLGAVMHRSQGVSKMLPQDNTKLLNMKESKAHMLRIEELQPYLFLVENPQNINEISAPQILAQLSYGFRKSGEYLALAQYQWASAKNERKSAEAVAGLDGVRTYAVNQKNRGIDVKITEDVRKHYINIDPAVKAASDKEALFEAMLEQLRTIKMEFLMAISTAKAIAYGRRDSDMMSGSSVHGER
jgi:hypothetical protein